MKPLASVRRRVLGKGFSQMIFPVEASRQTTWMSFQRLRVASRPEVSFLRSALRDSRKQSFPSEREMVGLMMSPREYDQLPFQVDLE